MMQKDDITVVSEGLMDGLNEEIWNLEYLERTIGNKTYHKFRKFERKQLGGGQVTFAEVDGLMSLKLSDFFRYLEFRRQVLQTATTDKDSRMFSFVDKDDQRRAIDVQDVVLYMIDFDLPKLLPELFEDFRTQSKLKENFPGGDWCMMNKVRVGWDFYFIS